MRKLLKAFGWVIAAALLASLAIAGGFTYRFFKVTPVKLDDSLWVYLGGGGNSAVLSSPDGLLVVDTKMWKGSSQLLEGVRSLGLGRVRAIVETHFHADHTHGTPLFPQASAIYAAAPTRELMLRQEGSFWLSPEATRLMPNRPVQGTQELTFGQETVRLIQLPPSHTGGDLAVLFVGHRVVHAGDLVFNGLYPNIDLSSGGSARGYVAALDLLLSLPWDRCIPGHGPIASRADVERFRDYMVALNTYAAEALQRGLSVEQAEREAPPSLHAMKPLTAITSLKGNLVAAMAEARFGPAGFALPRSARPE